MVKYKDCKKTKTTWKDLQKAWSTTAEAYLKNTRKSNPLDEKYKEMIGRLQPLHSIVMLIKGKFYIFWVENLLRLICGMCFFTFQLIFCKMQKKGIWSLVQ